MTSEIVLGIDFGTSYTSAGVLVGGRVELVQDQGDPSIPSVVYVSRGGDLVVGAQAACRIASDPGATISSVKRLLGIHTADGLRRAAATFPHQLRLSGTHVVVSTRSGDFACEQLAAAILAKTRDLAERRFGGRVKRAVMSVPASATREYVAALMRAARLAHFEIGQIVSEPIAGSLALGLHGTSARRRLLVCDFGGGTFDVSAIVQEGLKFSPVATAGEEFLGGDDLDSAMAGAISHRIFRNTKFNMLDDRVRHAQLVQRCESVKRTLSTQATARLTMRDAFIEKGEHRALDVVMERSWVEPFWLPLVQRAVDCVSTALARARWSADSVEQIVLIGGSSTVPMYRAALVAAFGADRVASTPLAGIAVGMGAALVTAKYVAPGGIVPVLAPPSIDDDIPIEICG